MDREAARHLDRERSVIMALNLSVAYNVATALLTGGVGPADLAPPATADPVRWELAGKVRVVEDPELNRAMLAATAPLGEAIRTAGERARGWFAEFAAGVRPRAAGADGRFSRRRQGEIMLDHLERLTER